MAHWCLCLFRPVFCPFWRWDTVWACRCGLDCLPAYSCQVCGPVLGLFCLFVLAIYAAAISWVLAARLVVFAFLVALLPCLLVWFGSGFSASTCRPLPVRCAGCYCWLFSAPFSLAFCGLPLFFSEQVFLYCLFWLVLGHSLVRGGVFFFGFVLWMFVCADGWIFSLADLWPLGPCSVLPPWPCSSGP